MAKLTLTDLTSQYGSTTAINANNALIEAALENTLSRDGTTPNTMSADIDMGTNEVINLKEPTNNNSAARLQDVLDSASSLTSGTAVTTSITDSGGYYSSDNVEGALAEAGLDLVNVSTYNYGESNSIDRPIDTRLQTKAFISDWSGDLSQAITDISTDETTLVIDTAVDTAGTPVTQPSTLAFEFTRTGSIDDSVGGGGLTANGPILAGQWQIFGSGLVVSGLSKALIKWFGAVGDGATDDTAALIRADTASLWLVWPEGTYMTDGVQAFGHGIRWDGAGGTHDNAKTIIKARGSQAYVLQTYGQNNVFNDILFDGDFLTTTAVVEVGIGQSTIWTQFNRCTFTKTLKATAGTSRIVYLNANPGNIQIDTTMFRDCYIHQDGVAANEATYAVQTVGTNAFENHMERTIIADGDTLFFIQGGGIELRDCQYFKWTAATGAVYMAGNANYIIFNGGYTEGTDNLPFLNVVAPTEGGTRTSILMRDFTFNGTNISNSVTTAQPITLIDNSFSGNFALNTPAGVNTRYPVVAINNAFLDAKEFTGAEAGSVIEIGTSTVPDTGAHDGANNQAIMTDSGESWTVDQFVGGYIYNITDSSDGRILSNTATTVTAVLSGGTDDDWDTGDSYVIVKPNITRFPDLIQSQTIEITNAEIKALVATPKTLISAPGAGYIADFISATLLLDYSGGALAEPAAPDDLAIEYDSGTGQQIATWDTTGFITATEDAIEIITNPNVSGGATTVTAAANVNKNIVLINTGSDYTGAGSTSTIRVVVFYRIIKTGL